MRYGLLTIFTLSLTEALLAQSQSRLHFGISGGASLVPTYQRGFYPRDESKRYIAGASVELSLTSRISLFFNPNFRRSGHSAFYDYSLYTPAPGEQSSLISQSVRSRTNEWDFPLQTRFYLTKEESKFRPFLGMGINVTYLNERNHYSVVQRDPPVFRSPQFNYSRNNVSAGGVASAGFLWRVGRFSVGPEVRLSSRPNNGLFSPGRQGRVDALLHLRF